MEPLKIASIEIADWYDAANGGVMAIYRILKDSAFEPKDIYRMGVAYERALMLLGLRDCDDPITEIIAKLIIEIAETGEENPETMCTLALRRLNETKRAAS